MDVEIQKVIFLDSTLRHEKFPYGLFYGLVPYYEQQKYVLRVFQHFK